MFYIFFEKYFKQNRKVRSKLCSIYRINVLSKFAWNCFVQNVCQVKIKFHVCLFEEKKLGENCVYITTTLMYIHKKCSKLETNILFTINSS